MKEKLGLIEDKSESEKPLKKAITTFVAFNVIGLIPLIPFVFVYFAGIVYYFSVEIDRFLPILYYLRLFHYFPLDLSREKLLTSLLLNLD